MCHATAQDNTMAFPFHCEEMSQMGRQRLQKGQLTWQRLRSWLGQQVSKAWVGSQISPIL